MRITKRNDESEPHFSSRQRQERLREIREQCCLIISGTFRDDIDQSEGDRKFKIECRNAIYNIRAIIGDDDAND